MVHRVRILWRLAVMGLLAAAVFQIGPTARADIERNYGWGASDPFTIVPYSPAAWQVSSQFVLVPYSPVAYWLSDAFQVEGVQADVNRDGCVNVADLLSVRNALGKPHSQAPLQDIVGDGDGVNVADLLYVRNRMGKGCCQ